MLAASDASAKVATSGPSVAISAKVVPSDERSTLNPSSSMEPSVQARLMRLLETAVAARFVGAAGGA